jgi:hypothetical protein
LISISARCKRHVTSSNHAGQYRNDIDELLDQCWLRIENSAASIDRAPELPDCALACGKTATLRRHHITRRGVTLDTSSEDGATSSAGCLTKKLL